MINVLVDEWRLDGFKEFAEITIKKITSNYKEILSLVARDNGFASTDKLIDNWRKIGSDDYFIDECLNLIDGSFLSTYIEEFGLFIISKMENACDEMRVFYSSGYVIGNTWGGGEGIYPAENVGEFESVELLLKEANKMLSEGTLDGGFGFESLIGAALSITKKTTLKNGFTKKEFEEDIVIGDVNENQREQLLDALGSFLDCH